MLLSRIKRLNNLFFIEKQVTLLIILLLGVQLKTKPLLMHTKQEHQLIIACSHVIKEKGLD